MAEVGSTKRVKAIVAIPLITPERPIDVRATATSSTEARYEGWTPIAYTHITTVLKINKRLGSTRQLNERSSLKPGSRCARRTSAITAGESSRTRECGTDPRASNECTPRRNT